MSLDLTGIRTAPPTRRDYAVYREAQTADFKLRKINTIATLLDTGARARAGFHTALVVDIKA